MISLPTILFTVALGAFLYLYFNKGKKWKFPPGPLSLPIIGSLLSFGKQPFKAFMKWGEMYPQMCTIGFGRNKVVLLNDLQLIRDTFADARFAGRANLELFTLGSDGQHGVINSLGPEWVEQRRFTLRNLRDFGFGKKTMETLIMEDVNEFSSHLKDMEGQPISDLMKRFNLTVINSLWTILSGKRHNHTDDVIANILSTFVEAKESGGVLMLLLPSLCNLFPNLSGYNKLKEIFVKERELAANAIKQHQDTLSEDGPRDFMDTYLNEIKATTDPSSSFYKERGIHSLKAVTLDLFNAATDTTSATLTWTILYLAKFQEVQKKFQEELDNVVGRDRQISVTDRPNLPYSEALFLEILRYSSIIIFPIFHTTMEDIEDFHGYSLPKGTLVTSNQYFIHHNSKYFEEPELFKPERFLTEDGKKVKKSEAFIPFGTGKRVCLGETLARDEVFLFMTNIFQRFHVKLSDGSLNISLEHKGGLTGEPLDFAVIFEERL